MTLHDTLVEEIAVELALRTDPGRDPDKQVNEDAGFHKTTRFGTLCVVCDGMGGHANGQDASRAATQAIQETFDTAPDGSAGRELLRVGITLGHQRIRALPLAPGEARSGSTVVAVLITPHGAEIAHVGDSRVYALGRGQIVQVTRDHSMVQLMVDAGMIKPEEAATHPDANKIMRALGIAPSVEVELRPEPLAFGPGDVFVLASDGLTDLVSDAEILAIAGQLPLEQAAGQLVDLANARGGHDNITVLLARTREPSLVASARVAPPLAKTLVSIAAPPAIAATAVDPPHDRAGATVLAAPLVASPRATPPKASATLIVAPLPAPPPAPAGPGPMPYVAPVERGSQAPRGPRSTVVILVVALAVVAALVGLAAGLYGVLTRPKHVDPTLVVPLSALPHMGPQGPQVPTQPGPSGAAPPDEPPTPKLEDTPPLAPPPPPSHRRRPAPSVPLPVPRLDENRE